MDPTIYALALLTGSILSAVSLIGVTLGSIRRVDQGNEALVQRFGRYHRKLTAGLNYGVLPIIDEVVVEATTREQTFDVEPNKATTNDRVILNIDSVIFWRIIDLYSAFYEIDNVRDAMKNLVVSALRSKVGEMSFQQIYSSREEINGFLLKSLNEDMEVWGITVTRVEIQDILLVEALKDTVSFPFPNGIDWQAFESSFRKVVVENEGIELSVESIEKREDGVLVIKVKVPPNVDKEKILIDLICNYESSVNLIEQRYQKELQGKEEHISTYRQHYSTLEGIVHKLADRPRLEPATIEIKAIAGSNSMYNSNDQSQNINVGRDVNLSGSTLNLGTISGNVTNTIDQLQNTDRPEAAQLADLLKQLQTAIESETHLSEGDKALALEQAGTLAEVGKNPTNETAKKPARLAIGFLKGLVSALPDTAKLAEACSKLLPLITNLLSL